MLMALSLRKLLRPAAAFLVTLLAVLFIWRNWAQVSTSITSMRHVSLTTLLLSIALMIMTFVLAAFSYSLLVFRKLPLRELLLVELAAACVNRVVPSGLGGLGLHGLYLHHRKHSVAQATAVVSVNNLLGMFVHLSLLAGVFLAGSASGFHLGSMNQLGWVLAGISAALTLAASVQRIRRSVRSFIKNLLVSLRRYEHEPHRIVYASMALCGLTLLHVSILYLATSSMGILVDAPTLFVIYSAGVLFGATVPTPGGLAGFEAGLVGGFMLHGINSITAIAIALIFRFVTYWLPIIPGAIALFFASRRKLV